MIKKLYIVLFWFFIVFAHAQTYKISGVATAWDTPSEIHVKYDEIPHFTGTIDSSSGAYNFVFDPFTANISMYGMYATITTTGLQYSGTGSGKVTVGSDTKVTCTGESFICNNQPITPIDGTLSFTLNQGNINGDLKTTQEIAGYTATVTYHFPSSDLDYDSIVNVHFVVRTAFLGWTCTNSKAKENDLNPDSKGISCGKTYGVGYNADWYLKKGDKICVHVMGFFERTNFVWQLMDTDNSNISLWGMANNPQMSFSKNLKYIGNYDNCDKM